MPMLEQNSDPEIGSAPPHAVFEQQQRRRMLIALGVLLLALVAVVIKDRQFWFPPSPTAESEASEQVVSPVSRPTVTPKVMTEAAPSKPVAPARERPKSKHRAAKAAPSAGTDDAMSPVITATNRAVLPPLEVEVVAGNQHRALSPGDSSVKLEMQPGTAMRDEQSPQPGSGSSGSIKRYGACSTLAGERASSFPGGPQLSAAREADESARRGHPRGFDQQDRQHSGYTSTQRAGNSFGGCPRGGEAVALQALLPERPAGGNRGSHHSKLHNINLLIEIIPIRIKETGRRSVAVV